MAKKPYLSSFDLQGFTRMATDAILGITELVESLHKQIVHPAYLPSTPIQNLISEIANISFLSIKFSTKLIGEGLDKILGQLNLRLSSADSSFEKEVIIGVLNGIVGDYLENCDNPLYISMELRHQGIAFDLQEKSIKEALPKINGKILLMVHGLCMNDLLWHHNGHNHGEALARDLDFTPLYLHYNTGRHISQNGQSLSLLLEQLISNWPVPVEELVLLTHSMGGLVARSALHYGEKEQKAWSKQLKKLFFLGTPHHGSPIERAGNYIDTILDATAYTKPFARLGKIRSAGITDLRYGNLVDEDWNKIDRFKKQIDQRKHLPLSKIIESYSIAATLGKKHGDLPGKLIGDGLVYLESALGKHKNPDKSLDFKEACTSIIYECNHMDLLSKAEVYKQLKIWLKDLI